MREQHAFDYSEQRQAIPPRRSATREELLARHQTAGRLLSRTQSDPPASTHRAGHFAGIHPEDAPYSTGAYAPRQRPTPINFDEADLADGPARPPTSIRRWDIEQQPRQKTRSLYAPAQPTRRLSGPPRWLGVALLCTGAGLFVMIVGWVLLSALGTWWTNQQNTWAYGFPRTYQVDAVVGHGDSPAHPSHFLAMNLHRQILVIELPGGNPTRAHIYLGPILIGDGQELVPVTVSFEVSSTPGRPDLYIHVGDQVIVFRNDGKQFVAPSHS